MNDRELERWTTLVVAQARGEQPSKAEQAERHHIERDDAELCSEASLWAEFAELGQPRAGERDDAELTTSVLMALALDDPHASHPAQRDDHELIEAVLTGAKRAARRTSAARASSAALLGLAACLGLAFGLVRLLERGEASESERGPGHREAAMLAEPGELRIAEIGEHRLAADECVQTRDGTRLCARTAVSLRIAAGAQADQLVVALEQGELDIDTSDAGARVEIVTAAGSVIPRGLVRVRFDARGELLDIAVVRGESELVRVGSPAFRLGLGATLSLAAAASEPRDVAADAPAPAVSEPATRPVAARKRSEPKSSTEAASPDAGLAAAQDALAAGQTSDAIVHYEGLIAAFPTSKQAAIARVSLGRLLLRKGRDLDALAAFDAYLAGDERELAEEAELGRIKALVALGRRDELERAIADFLAAHPGSIHRAKLESWREGSAPERP